MAFSAITAYCPQVLRLSRDSPSIPVLQNWVSLRFSRSVLNCRKPLPIRSVSVSGCLLSAIIQSLLSFPVPQFLPAAPASGALAPAISLTDNALKHLNRMRAERNDDLCLRIGVKQGGCSGMSYTMEFEDRANTKEDDSIIEYNGFVIVCDPKSLLFLFGMQLDYSDALIGGGFSFKNPNATQTCGCGKSFAAEM